MTSVRHRKNIQHLDRLSEVVACEEVGEYRAAAHCLVKPTDCVLEVGSHVGGTSKVLYGLCKKLVGLDQQADLVAEARRRLPHIQFEIGDAFDGHLVLRLQKEIGQRFNKVFIDISGSRDISTVVRLMEIYDNTLRPDVMIVKSQHLKRRLMKSQNWITHPARPRAGERQPPPASD